MKHKLGVWFSIVFLSGGLIGCGSQGGDVADANSANRSDYANTSESLEPCRKVRDNTATQPLRVYVDELKKLAIQGEPCAQYGLGTLYTMGYESIIEDRGY